MQSEIVQRDNPVLREVAKEVPVDQIQNKKIQGIIKRMVKALEAEEDGVALAAPQIGESLRIFVVSWRAFEIMAEAEGVFTNKIFINPEIIKTSKQKQNVEEGCLSVRWLYGKVERPLKTLVKAYDENGQPFTMGGVGLLSQIFNHEIEHLDGGLFIDKAKHLEEMPPNTK